MENLDEEDRANLRRLWLARGGEADDIREFHSIVREAGVHEAPLAPETKEPMEARCGRSGRCRPGSSTTA